MENKDKLNIRPKELIRKYRYSYILNVSLILTVTFSVLYLFGLVPNEFKSFIGREPVKESVGESTGELPVDIQMPDVGIDVFIYNPQSTSTKILDEHLLKGAVRYPGSGLLGSVGNILLLGHSTSFKVVNNQAYKAFNGVKDLKSGDIISVLSDSNEYTYRVISLEKEEASNVKIDFETDGRKLLTLVTCNTSVSSKEARYIAVAEFVSKKALD